MGTSMLWGALVAVFPLFAQQQNERTLGNLWLKVEGYYPGIGVKQAAIDAAKMNESVVKSNSLPQIKAQAQNSYGTYEGTSGPFFAQPGLFNVGGSGAPMGGSAAVANTFASATLDWQLFSFGRIRSEQQAAGMLYHKSISERDAYIVQLKKLLAERYIFLLYNDATLSWKAKNVRRLHDISKITSVLAASGLRPAADSLLATASYLQASGDYDHLEGIQAAAAIKVLELFGGTAPLDYRISLTRFNNPTGDNNGEVNTINPSHPVLETINKQADYLVLRETIERKASLPSIHLLGGYSYRGTGIDPQGVASGTWQKGFSNSSTNVLGGIGLTWNITNLHTRRLKANQLATEVQGTKLLQAQYEQAMQADLSASQVKINKQYMQLHKSTLAVKQAQNAFDMYLARYKSGLISLSELLQIQALLEQAEKATIHISHDYWMLLAYEAELTANFDFLFNNL